MLNFDFPSVAPIPKGTGLCLDLGCGSGIHRKSIEDSGYQWVGLDIDTSRGTARLLEGDACRLPFKSNTFALVLMNCVLEHVSNPWLALSEAHRILAQGGTIVGVSGYLDPDPTHKCLLTHLGLKQVFTDVGFEEVELTPGTSAFPVVFRKLHMHLFGYNPLWNTFFGFSIAWLLWIPWYLVYSLMTWAKYFAKREPFSVYKKRMAEVAGEIRHDFAAYFIFSAAKQKLGGKSLKDQAHERISD